MNIGQWVKDNTIHSIVAGSRLYGTAREDSDIDIRGVCLGPPETLIGLSEFKQYQGGGEDSTIYELRRFCSLALAANPNILDILFAPLSAWQVEDSRWQIIYDNRHAFLSEKVRYTFSGYAISQLKRIERHRKWLVDPPDHKPTQVEYEATWDGSTFQFPKIAREKEYRAANEKWKNYQRWLKERNPKRAELERKYLYDVKHASHLVRLCIKVQSVLLTGTYYPDLRDGELIMVLDVLNGKWQYELLVAWAEGMDTCIREMSTSLPRAPNRKLVEQLCMQIYREEFRKEAA